MHMTSIAFLVPLTSNKSKWTKPEDSFLYLYLLPTLCETAPKDNYNYHFYFGIDKGENIYTVDNLLKMVNYFSHKYGFNFTVDTTEYENVKPGHLTKMWNILLDKAHSKKIHNYYYQCGDDIFFMDSEWLQESIRLLRLNNDFGISGPAVFHVRKDTLCEATILTQVLISNKHYDIFGKMFPEELKNWYCDNWVNYVYKNGNVFKDTTRRCKNVSVEVTGERYRYSDNKTLFTSLAEKDVIVADNFISSYKLINNE